MKYQKFIYIVLGGGCSALSLTTQVIDNNIDGYSFLILESRKKYTDDRTWCFWAKKKDSFNNLISKSWDSFSFSLKKDKIKHYSNKYHYKYIRSIDFYNNSINKIKKSSNVKLKLNEIVKNVIREKKNYIVQTNKMIYLAKNVIDTRAGDTTYLKKPFLLQSFLGYEIKVKGYEPNFDFVKIMDDMRAANNSFFFDYILPIGLNKYLVEITSFSKKKNFCW